jgi:hypothetical protein
MSVKLNDLDLKTRKGIMDAFKATGAMDLYEDEVALYLQVIKQDIEEKQRLIDKLISLNVKIRSMISSTIGE